MANNSTEQTYLKNFLMQFDELSKEERESLAKELDVRTFAKGSVLLRQGEPCYHCYFVLSGCVRQYGVNEDGQENTSFFFTEGHAVAQMSDSEMGQEALHFWEASQDSVLLVGDLRMESAFLQKYPPLADIIRKMLEKSFGKTRQDFAQFISSSPIQRYESLKESRPELLERVPQHQIASYLGITPESLSRLKRRL
jgi:CRP-like cAMP-binding protein